MEHANYCNYFGICVVDRVEDFKMLLFIICCLVYDSSYAVLVVSLLTMVLVLLVFQLVLLKVEREVMVVEVCVTEVVSLWLLEGD